MPKSRKPRRRYTPRPTRLPFVLPNDVERISGLINDIAIAVEMKLHRGLFNDEDVANVNDFMNWVGFSLCNRSDIDPDYYSEAVDIQNATIEALGSMIKRSNKIHRAHPKTEQTFVPTGDELRDIREGVTYFLEPMKEALEYEPNNLLKEYRAMKIYMHDHRENRPGSEQQNVMIKNFY